MLQGSPTKLTQRGKSIPQFIKHSVYFVLALIGSTSIMIVAVLGLVFYLEVQEEWNSVKLWQVYNAIAIPVAHFEEDPATYFIQVWSNMFHQVDPPRRKSYPRTSIGGVIVSALLYLIVVIPEDCENVKRCVK